jgi:hypothetical protein
MKFQDLRQIATIMVKNDYAWFMKLIGREESVTVLYVKPSSGFAIHGLLPGNALFLMATLIRNKRTHRTRRHYSWNGCGVH